jgi:hypothetical protein
MEFSGAALLAVGGVLGLLLLFGATAVFARDPVRRETAMTVLRLLLTHNALPWSRRTPRDSAQTTPAIEDIDNIDDGKSTENLDGPRPPGTSDEQSRTPTDEDRQG